MRTTVYRIAPVAALAALLLAGPRLPAEVLVMKDGKTIEGEVAEQGDAYEVKTRFGTLKVDKADVAKRVAGPEAMAAEAETLRVTARAMIEGAASVEDPALRVRKLGAAVEILNKALETYSEARAIFKGEAYAHLDKAAAEVAKEIREAKGTLPPTPASGTSGPAPARASSGGTEPPPSSGGSADLLAPPPPPSSLNRAPPPETAGTGGAGEAAPARPEFTPIRALWFFLHGRKAALVGKTHEIRFANVGTRPVLVSDILHAQLVVTAENGEKHSVDLDRVATESALALARAALNAGDDPMRPQVAWCHASLGAPEQALDLYLRAMELGAPVDPDRLAQALTAFAEVAAGGVLDDFDGAPAKLKTLRDRAGSGASAPLTDALARAEAALKEAEALRPAIRKLAEARQAVERGRFDDARYRLEQIVKGHPDAPLGREAERILAELPHPDGRLICGFDTARDMGRWYAYKGYENPVFSFELTTEKPLVREGEGAAHWVAGKNPAYSNGGLVIRVDQFDPARFRGLSLWAFQARPGAGSLEFAFVRGRGKEESAWPGTYRAEDIDNCLYRALPLNWAGWRQFKFAAAEFKVRGRITWREAERLVLYEPSRKGVDLVLDSLRLVESVSK